jgi:hypothetical protein
MKTKLELWKLAGGAMKLINELGLKAQKAGDMKWMLELAGLQHKLDRLYPAPKYPTYEEWEMAVLWDERLEQGCTIDISRPLAVLAWENYEDPYEYALKNGGKKKEV